MFNLYKETFCLRPHPKSARTALFDKFLEPSFVLDMYVEIVSVDHILVRMIVDDSIRWSSARSKSIICDSSKV
jgi:hypothetical protein